MFDLELFKQVIMEVRDGITIADARQPDTPLIFVNPAFERLTGYTYEEATSRNCRFLQGTLTEQGEVQIVREALAQGKHCLVTVKNFRKDGSLFWNELSISPVRNEHGELRYFIGIQKDVTARVLLDQQLQEQHVDLKKELKSLALLSYRDGLTGIYNRRYFDMQLEVQWKIGLRNKLPITLFMVDVDHFKSFNDHYGHQAGDGCLKQIAQSLSSSFLRGSDFVARYGGEEFVVLTTAMNSEQAMAYAEKLRQKIQALKLPHSYSPVADYVTVSIGYVLLQPEPDLSSEVLLGKADKALYQAKNQNKNCVCTI